MSTAEIVSTKTNLKVFLSPVLNVCVSDLHPSVSTSLQQFVANQGTKTVELFDAFVDHRKTFVDNRFEVLSGLKGLQSALRISEDEKPFETEKDARGETFLRNQKTSMRVEMIGVTKGQGFVVRTPDVNFPQMFESDVHLIERSSRAKTISLRFLLEWKFSSTEERWRFCPSSDRDRARPKSNHK